MASDTMRAIFLLADYGHDPTETAIPFHIFRKAGFTVSFATESGAVPSCDKLMLQGWTQKLLGAAQPAVDAYNSLTQDPAWKTPLSWTDSKFSLLNFDLVFLPGGHEKGVRQMLDSSVIQDHLVSYFPLTRRGGEGKKVIGAICHGVQLLAHTRDPENKRSLLHSVSTTALPAAFENAAYQSTRLWLGDYYKTYGAGSANVEAVVRASLDDPAKQWKGNVNPGVVWVVEDEGFAYLSGRWPGDAVRLAERIVETVREAKEV